jgi:hypothetical protein
MVAAMETPVHLSFSEAWQPIFTAKTTQILCHGVSVQEECAPRAGSRRDSPETRVVCSSADPRQKNYLVTLRQACHALGFIPRVGISSSGHSGFDYVTVGTQRCAIQSINAINPAEQADLTEARLVESAPDSGS